VPRARPPRPSEAAFFFDAASGVMKYLEAHKVGFPAGPIPVPIVSGAFIFDLGVGFSVARPDARMAREACRKDTTNAVAGSAGAGTEATVGKFYSMAQAMKGGVGFASLELGLVLGFRSYMYYDSSNND
jgi:L-aminopeptidase/D-esterase-like protein